MPGSRILSIFCLALVFLFPLSGHADPHTNLHVAKRQNNGGGGGGSGGGGNNIPLQIANWCDDDIYPGILTQNGNGPSTTGFHLSSGGNQTLSVSNNWQGRVWGRTNCSFSSSGQAQSGGGTACTTGDCGGAEQCVVAGQSPATLAEFTLQGSESQTFYDISLVDGYNLPLAIVLLANGVSQLQSLQGSGTNPSCVASVGDLAAQNFNPYTGGQQFLGTSSSDPLPFETQNTASSVADWCPWDLQVNAPQKPGNGVYPYPDGNVQRPAFDPCLSACAKYNSDQYCCTGAYDGPGKCAANYYSKAAKTMCPDAYSYAYDDSDSTFSVPQGGGFQVIFCPGGRSTTILESRDNSSSSGSCLASTFRLGWLVIDGRVGKAVLVGVVVLLFLT